MKKRTGFTLIELLIVILIIGVLFTIAIVLSSSSSKRLNQRLYEEKLDYILIAAKQFGEASKTFFTGDCNYLTEPVSDAKCFNVTVQNLVDNNYLKEEDLLDPRDNTNLSDLRIEVQSYYSRVHAVVHKGAETQGGKIEINNGASVTSSRTVVLGIESFDANTKEMCISNTQTCQNWESYNTVKGNWVLTDDYGKKTVSVWFRDSLKNVNGPVKSSINYDPNDANGTIIINNGDSYTKDTKVTLKLTSKASSMCISNDNACTNWRAFSSVVNDWQLLSEDGIKTVSVWFRDEEGGQFGNASSSIILDSKAPEGTLKINNGATHTRYQNVYLNLAATDIGGSGVESMCISNTTECSSWKPYQEGIYPDWNLIDDKDGIKTVYVWYRDNIGNVTSPISATITMDQTPPSKGTIVINGGDPYTKDLGVSLSISNPDTTPPTHMCISQTKTCSTWIAYAKTYNTDLLSGDGNKIVYVMFKDAIGNPSEQSEAKILLDQTSPSCVATKSNTNTTTGVTVKVTGNDGALGSGIASGNVTEENIKATKTYTVTDKVGLTGTCTVEVTAENQTRKSTCSTYKSCQNAACLWNDCLSGSNTCKGGYNTCRTSGCGVELYKTCSNAACGYKTCSNAACGAKTCRTSACGVELYKSCPNAACGYNTCANAACGAKTCRTSACGVELYKSCTNAACGYNSCANAACGYNSCANAACGCATYNTCVNVACGCATTKYMQHTSCGYNSSSTGVSSCTPSGSSGNISYTTCTSATLYAATCDDDPDGGLWVCQCCTGKSSCYSRMKARTGSYKLTKAEAAASCASVMEQACYGTSNPCFNGAGYMNYSYSTTSGYNRTTYTAKSCNVCTGYKSCATSACGCAAYKSCPNAACGYNTCANAACGAKTCRTSACGVELYKSCANAACGYNSCAASGCGNLTCRTSACGVELYKSCQNSACGYNSCAASGCGNLTCRTSACGVELYKSCQNSECGWNDCLTGSNTCVGGYNTCRTSACGCETFGSWSAWSTGTCSPNELTKCESRTIYY